MVGQQAPLLRFYGPNTAQALQLLGQLKTNEWLDIGQKTDAQQNALRTLLRHAHQYSPFWREKLTKAGFEVERASEFNLSKLTPLSREQIQTNFLGLRARWPQFQPDKVFTVATSGSTGQPVRVEKYADFYQPLDQALALLELEWFKRDPGKTIAYIGPQVEDKTLSTWGGVYQALGYNGPYYKRNFSDKTVESHLHWLCDIRPDYLKCSPFLAAQMAQLAIEMTMPLHINQIVSVSETVSPRQRALCRQGLRALIVDRYSSEETGMIALQCPTNENNLHVIDASVFIEIVDAAGKACEQGQVGRVLVTSLHSYAMPIIRYDLGDLAEWGTCDCGRTMPVIKRVWGRTRASVMVPGRGLLPMGFIGDDLGKIESVREFRLKQYGDQVLELELVMAQAINPSDIRQIQGLFESYGLGDLPLFLAQKESIDWPPNKKRQEFVQVDERFLSNFECVQAMPI